MTAIPSLRLCMFASATERGKMNILRASERFVELSEVNCMFNTPFMVSCNLPSARPFVRPSVRPPARPSVRPFVRPSVRPSRACAMLTVDERGLVTTKRAGLSINHLSYNWKQHDASEIKSAWFRMWSSKQVITETIAQLREKKPAASTTQQDSGLSVPHVQSAKNKPRCCFDAVQLTADNSNLRGRLKSVRVIRSSS